MHKEEVRLKDRLLKGWGLFFYYVPNTLSEEDVQIQLMSSDNMKAFFKFSGGKYPIYKGKRYMMGDVLKESPLVLQSALEFYTYMIYILPQVSAGSDFSNVCDFHYYQFYEKGVDVWMRYNSNNFEGGYWGLKQRFIDIVREGIEDSQLCLAREIIDKRINGPF